MRNALKIVKNTGALALASALLVGCGGGARVMSEPIPVTAVSSIASATDESIDAMLDWVIVRDGPGTWSENADWDEYVITIHNRSDVPVQIESAQVIDSMGTLVGPRATRKQLVKETRRTIKRYESADLSVRAGASPGALLAAGGVAAVAGSAIYSTATLAYLFSGSAAAAGPMVAATGLVVAAPVFAVGGLVSASRNHAVDEEIQRRRAMFPVIVAPGEAQSFSVFFPLAPSPQSLDVRYRRQDQEPQVITLDTQEALAGLHVGVD